MCVRDRVRLPVADGLCGCDDRASPFVSAFRTVLQRASSRRCDAGRIRAVAPATS